VKRPVMTLALVAFCVLLFLKPAEAPASQIKLVVDGKWVYTDVPPVLAGGRVLVPLRGVFEAIGGHAEWLPSENAVLARKGARLVKLYIGSAVAYVGNFEPVVMDVAPRIISGRTMVPLRFVAEALGCDVDWDSVNQNVIIRTGYSSPVEDVVKLVRPAVVLVETDGGLGSGFFWDSGGEVVTCAHVVAGAKAITVKTFDGGRYSAVIDRMDPIKDLAILRVQGGGTSFKFIPFYKGSAEVREGQEVVVVGNPFGLEASVSSGIISGIRHRDGVKLYQITAPVSPGNSGGPLLTIDGDVIGVVTIQLTEGQNINFALPIDYYFVVKARPPYSERDEVTVFAKELIVWVQTDLAIGERIGEAFNVIGAGDRVTGVTILETDVLPKLYDLRRKVSSFSSSNEKIQACVDLFSSYLNLMYEAVLDLKKGYLYYDNSAWWRGKDKLNAAYSTRSRFVEAVKDLISDVR